MYCYQHRTKSYIFIVVMFSAFPYLLWQAFGNGIGFLVGVLLTFILVRMMGNLFRQNGRSAAVSIDQRSSQRPLVQEEERAREPYQQGYRAQPYRAEQPQSQTWESQSQYEEMQVPYPQQELPPMEQQ